MAQPLTMDEIAKELGLSRYTVSLILNGRTSAERRVSAATQRRVLEHIRQRGYVPSRKAINLRTRRSATVGLLYSNQLYTHLLEAFNEITAAVYHSPDAMELIVVKRAQLLEGVQELIARGVSRIVWIHTLGPDREFADPAVLNYLDRMEKVLIYNYHFGYSGLDDDLTSRGYHLIGVDRVQGFRALARFLRKLGHRIVAFPDLSISGGGVGQEREQAFAAEGVTGVRTLAVDPPSAYSLLRTIAPAMAEGVVRAMREQGVTAACLHGDEEAAFLVAELLRAGVRIPADLTVTGYEGLPIAEVAAKPVTTLSLPISQMVAKLKQILAGKELKEHRHCFKIELVERVTHGPARS